MMVQLCSNMMVQLCSNMMVQLCSNMMVQLCSNMMVQLCSNMMAMLDITFALFRLDFGNSRVSVALVVSLFTSCTKALVNFRDRH